MNGNGGRWPRILHHSFYAPPLGADSMVLDLGAATAGFSHALARRFGCLCHAVEALPENYALIDEAERVRKHHYAVTGTVGAVTLYARDQGFALGTLDADAGDAGSAVEVEGITLDALADRLGLDRIALVKLDIEGAELDALEAASDELLGRCGQITCEFHDFMTPKAGPRIAAILRRMKGLGFRVIRFTRRFHGDVLFVNESAGLGALKYLFARAVLRNTRGLWRIAERAISTPSAAG